MDLADSVRLRVLSGYAVLDTQPEPSFDRLTALAARILGMEMAVISFVDQDRTWYKSAHGLMGGWRPRDRSFDPCRSEESCHPAANGRDGVLLIDDASNDPATRDLDDVTGANQVRFYAGAPLFSPCGERLGTLAVLSRRAHHPFTEEQRAVLTDLAITVMDLLSSRLRDEELYRSRAELALLASYDPLTGLVNRQRLTDRLQTSLDAAETDQGREQVSVLILDLDGLEPLSDSLGHPQGDRLLRQVADRLRAGVPHADLVARFAGGGFAVMHIGKHDERAVISLVRRLIRIAGMPYDVEDGRVSFPASVGIASNLGGETSAEQLLRNARLAAAKARAAGGGYRVFERGMGRRAERRQAIRLDLGAALERDEFCLMYQPLMDIRTSRVVSFEALLRWQHPARGLVSPAEFIPMAEQGGLIDDIGTWVLRQACKDATAWADDISVSVNLSPVQFRSAWLPQAIRQALDDAGLPPSRLELEITESVLLPNTGANLAIMKELRGMGVRLAMDDFGAGAASLGYLRDFAFDKIKIDQAFVRDMGEHDSSAAIIRAITSLARDLGVATAAEGVENEAQLDQLRAESCDQAQGFLFSRPVPYGDVQSLMASFGQ